MSLDSDRQRHRFDRHVRLATGLTGETADTVLNKFVTQRVLLTGAADRLMSPAGRLMLATAGNLIARFCPRIDIWAPSHATPVAAEVLSLLEAIDQSPHAEIRVLSGPDRAEYGAVLSIGVPPTGYKGTTAIDGRGWLALVSQHGALPAAAAPDDGNPFGSLMAAALGAAEVFKHLLQLRAEKGSLFGNTTFSTYDYSVNGLDPGPPLPGEVALPRSLLAGVGAVGNAILLALSSVPGVRGELLAVDRQVVDDESNLNRYVLAVEADADPDRPTPKTELAVRLFDGRGLKVEAFQEDLEQFLGRLYRQELKRPEVILSAVDNNEARERLQKLWPTLLLEGATDDTVSQVSRHEYGRGLACLMCIHTAARRTEDIAYEDQAVAASGLSIERITAALQHDASIVVTAEDVKRAPEEKRPLLAMNIGRLICSVLAEVESMSTAPVEELPVRPAVSFVSLIAGLLTAAEMVKYATRAGSSLETFFQMDSMYPLSNAFLQAVERAKACYCHERSEAIRRYRVAVGETA